MWTCALRCAPGTRRGKSAGHDSQAAAYSGHHAGVALPAADVGSGRKLLSTVRTLIVDEIHAVVGNRRGSHLALSMERLAALVTGPAATDRTVGHAEADRGGRADSWSARAAATSTGNARVATIIDCGYSRETRFGHRGARARRWKR